MNNYKIIIYNEEEMHYAEGILLETSCEPEYVNYDNGYEQKSHLLGVNYTFGTNLKPDTETIQLDPTLMKRIAKYNKEKEIEKLEKEIKRKQKKLKELEDKIEDREKRWEKIQDYVANIYDIDLDDDDDDYDDYYDYDW